MQPFEESRPGSRLRHLLLIPGIQTLKKNRTALFVLDAEIPEAGRLSFSSCFDSALV
jgi:hypothetical protein